MTRSQLLGATRPRSSFRAGIAGSLTLLVVVACSSTGGTPGNPYDGSIGGEAGKPVEGGKRDGGKKDAGFVSHDAGANCGGRTGNPCGDGAPCKQPSDCQSDVCTNGICVAPAPTCAMTCGKTGCPLCMTGQTCSEGAMCASSVCSSGAVMVDAGASDGGPVDCSGGSCACQAASPGDGVKNDSETAIDCGGAFQEDGQKNPSSDDAPACADGEPCQIGLDCVSLVCGTGPVSTPDAGSLDGDIEASADGAPINCATTGTCTCQPAAANDGVKNDSETDVDCGGGTSASSDGASPCGNGRGCLVGADCYSLVCYTGTIDAGSASTDGTPIDCPAGMTCTCIPPANDDGVKNDSETGLDCGGGGLPGSDGASACPTGQGCVYGTDCQSLVCSTGPLTTASQNGMPVDCPMGMTCTCQAPTPHDGIKNDSETDIDCGGGASMGTDGAPPCADSKGCAVGTDCTSAFCSQLSGACIDGQSCVGLVTPAQIMDIAGCYPPATCPAGYTCDTSSYDCVDANGDVTGTPDPNGAGQSAGIDTCGIGEATDPTGQQHESCCKSLPLNVAACTAGSCPSGESCVGGTCQVRLDKYEVTTGRLRQFIEWVNQQEQGYNLRAWVQNQLANDPTGSFAQNLLITFDGSTAVMNQMVALLPQSNDGGDALNLLQQVGGTTMDEGLPSSFQGCYLYPGSYGAGTYWFNATDAANVGQPPRAFTQDYYDIKPENCIPYWMAASFCAWDGGHLPTPTEERAAYGNGSYPWGSTTPPYLFPGGGPSGGAAFIQTAENAGYPITGYTVDWANGSQTAGAQGDFYYYPSFATGNPTASVPDTLSNGLDQSIYIAAPGRFYDDLTTARSALGDGEGWQDFGANVMELMQTTLVASGADFCDTTTVGGSPNLGTCSRTTYTGATATGIIRATAMPDVAWEGGSWEGHGIAYTNFSFPMQTQYGKTGFRCARLPE